MNYKNNNIHNMLAVYRASSLHVGCIYKRVDVMAVRVWCLLFYNSYFIFYILTITFYEEQQYK